ncbi:unnamed protein product, partial [marine sediment metagenome]
MFTPENFNFLEGKFVKNSYFCDPLIAKKINKKIAPSSSSRDTEVFRIEERFSRLFGFDLLKDNFKKMILSNLQSKVEKVKNSDCNDSNILKMRIDAILLPLERLS